MNNSSKHSISIPAKGDTTPQNQDINAYSPRYNQKIVKALFPYSPRGEAVETTLNDNHGFLLDSLVCQAELLRDLGSKIQGNEDVEGRGLSGFADSLGRQLNVLAVIQNEYHRQVNKQKEQYKKELSEYKHITHKDAIKIKELERTIAMLKGGAL